MMNKYQFRRTLNRFLRGRLLKIIGLIKRNQTDVVSGSKVTYDPFTDIGDILFFNGQFEENELLLCKKYIREDSIILDIGANIGLHSLYFSELAHSGVVVSFEPSLLTFELLVRNLNGRSNVSPINVAISDVGGLLDFFQASDNAYSSLVDTKRKSIVNVSKVPCMKIDDVVDALKLHSVDFVKIDVEGLERNVLVGMEQVIATHNPVIFCEIYQGTASNLSPDETVKFLLDRQYNAYVMHDGKLIEYKKHEDEFYNYLFLPVGCV